MTHDEIVFAALAYRRYVGADAKSIRVHAWSREDRAYSQKEDKVELARLEAEGLVYQVGTKYFLTSLGLKQAKGSAIRPNWLSEDSWILLSLLYNGGQKPVRLGQIIGAADYINHAMPTLEEMHGALNRLAAGRLIGVRKNCFVVTPRTLEIFEKVEDKCKRGALNQLRCLQRLINCPCCGIELKRVRWRIELDQETMDMAYAEYRNRL